MNHSEIKKTLLSCPGDTIQETIDALGMSQAELAERLGRSVPKLNELIKGKAPITKETAINLEYVLGIPAKFWINLEAQYQEELAEIKRLEHLEKCKEWGGKFPLLQLKKLGVLSNTPNKSILAEELLKFFKVASPNQWTDIYIGSSVAFKIELKHTAEPHAISVWLRLGELQAEKLQLAAYDQKNIRQKLDEISELSYQKPDNWMQILQQICADCGIALVYTPCISKAPIYGASRWIKNNTIPLIQLTDRQKDYNAFWFSFYHELAHILYHGKKDIFITGLDSIKPDAEKEKQADEFAARMLLSEKERNELSQYFRPDKELVMELSRKFRKHPGIIAGQVQRIFNYLYKDNSLNKLKPKVEFEELRL
jgi:HTH-type transcriptional regulator / antitoxin HigA